MISVKAIEDKTPIYKVRKRDPIDLVCLIDIGFSMGKEKL